MAAFYPGLPLVSPAWDTRDRWMPWRLVAVLYGQLRHVLALHRLTGAQAMALGTAVTHAEKGAGARVLTATLDEAYPSA